MISITYICKHLNALKHFSKLKSPGWKGPVVCLQSSVNVHKTVWNSSMALVTDLMSVSFPKEKSGKKLHFLPVPLHPTIVLKHYEKPQASISSLLFLHLDWILLWTSEEFGLTVCAYVSRFLLLVPPCTSVSYAFQSSHTSHDLDSVVPRLYVQKCTTQCSLSFFLKLMHKYTPAV